MMTMRIAFIGGGHMATSLVGGLCARGLASDSIVVADPVAARLDMLQRRFGVRVTGDNTEAVRDADVVVLAVKPQDMAAVARSIAGAVAAPPRLVVSIAAGIRLADLRRWLGDGVPLVRTMPNRPALIGAGITALYAGPEVGPDQREQVEEILAACGATVWVPDEAQIDAVTAISGSGPAYFFLLVEALEAAGHELGLDAATARRLAAETARGAGRMVAESADSPADLRAQVTSTGGTTAAALDVLEAAGVHGIFVRAVVAAAARSVELARRFGSD